MAFRSSKLLQQHDMNMKKIQEKVRKAKFERKIFVISGRHYEAIRKGLVARGWLEKILDNQMPYVSPGTERLITGSLLNRASFNFIWQPKYRPFSIDENKPPYVNSIYRQRLFDFTTKDGLKNCAENLQWTYEEGVVEFNYFPRTHVLDDKAAKDEFFEDYRQTAFKSFINFLNSCENFKSVFSTAGTISTECIEFAINKIELLLKIKEHADIEMSKIFDVCVKFPKDQKKTLENIQHIIRGNKKFKFESDEFLEELKRNVKVCAEKINENWSELKYDGYDNIWIFKPLGASSGNGIVLENNETKIREILSNLSRTYIAQKYIERPMLIHNRKFDIRIYVLTTIFKRTVNIWLYKDCYVKFATKPFDLANFHRSIHVTNYAVQKYFMNDSEAVPNARENMWTLQQLIEYFGTIENPRLWEAKIYPAIKKTLLAMIIPSLEDTKIQHRNFELNGADFMITFDHEPTLIEINSVPALFFSRTVMDLITDKLLDDVIKVVVDHSKDSTAYTGDFEMIYSQEIPNAENTVDLTIVGKKIQPTVNVTYVKSDKQPIDVKGNTKLIETNRDLSSKYIYLKEN